MSTLVGGQVANASSDTAIEPGPESVQMRFRILGNTGLAVSVLGFGFWASLGSKADELDKAKTVAKAKTILAAARKHGINFFDNAETYGTPQGYAEVIMGEAMRQLQNEDPQSWRRSDIVVTTKLFWGGNGVNEKGLSRKHIAEGMAKSLQRLQLDYVDVVFCHRPDPYTPTATVVRAMTDLIRSGKATAWGTSEWSAQQITEAFWIAKSEGLEPPQCEQPQYNMVCRDRFEREYAPLFRAPYNIGTTTWSPLKYGILAGRYNDGIPAGSRLADENYKWLQVRLQTHKDKGDLDKVKRLQAYAQEHLDCTMAQLAIAWILKNPHVSTVLLGATKVSQLEENVGALRVHSRLTPAHVQAIEAILNNEPSPYSGYGFAASSRTIDLLD